MKSIFGLVVVLLSSSTARANFVLFDSDQMDVISYHDVGILYNSSTANVISGGSVYDLYVNDISTAIIEGGDVEKLYSYASSNVDISAGNVRSINAVSTSTVISGGRVKFFYTQGSGTLNLLDNGIIEQLQAFDDHEIEITGGILSYASLNDSCSLDIFAGKHGAILTYSQGDIKISGGSLVNLYAFNESHPTLYGHDFRVTAGLSLSDGFVTGTGILTGKWQDDDTPWMINISTTDNATIRLVTIPEPNVIVSLFAGILVLLSCRHKLKAGRKNDRK